MIRLASESLTFGSSFVQYRAGEIQDDDLVPPPSSISTATTRFNNNEEDDEDDENNEQQILNALREKASSSDISCAAADAFLNLCLTSSSPSTSSLVNTGSLDDPDHPCVYVIANLTLKFNKVRSSGLSKGSTTECSQHLDL